MTRGAGMGGTGGGGIDDDDLEEIAALDPGAAGVLAHDGTNWLMRTYAQVKTALVLAIADVSGLQTALDDKVSKTLFDANTMLKAGSDNTPDALTVSSGSIVGRPTGGSISAMTPAQVKTLLAIAIADVTSLQTSLDAKRAIAPRVVALTVSSNTYTANADTTDIATIASPAAAFTVAAPTGTPANGQQLKIRITSGATGYAPTWNAAFLASGIATLPTAALPASKTVTFAFEYDTSNSKWVLLAADHLGY